MDNQPPYSHILDTYRQQVDHFLLCHLPSTDTQPIELHKAMHYSVFNGGKRIRPILMYATAGFLGLAPKTMNAPAAALELIHAYSLIHDDLPAMDDDALRRGKPTCHIAFNEATAILAGDALQSLAFDIISQNTHATHTPSQQVTLIQLLARASGSLGMAGGQALDLHFTGKIVDEKTLENIHQHKTGALIRCAVQMACVSSDNLPREVTEHLIHYANAIGLAFQVQDDILDIEGDTETLGKQQGKDINDNKATYPAILGIAVAKEKAHRLHADALEHLQQAAKLLSLPTSPQSVDNSVISPLNAYKLLQYIAGYVVNRLK